MRARNLKRSVIKVAAVAAVSAALLAPGAAAGATSHEVGLTECERDGCAIVTVRDRAAKWAAGAAPAQASATDGRVGFTQ